jgi:hypothetical protein
MSFHDTSWQLWISRSIRLLARSRMGAWVLFNPRESKALPDRVQHHADGGRDECIAENRLYLRHRNAQAVAGMNGESIARPKYMATAVPGSPSKLPRAKT